MVYQIVSKKLKESIANIANNLIFYPVVLQGMGFEQQYYIMVITDFVDCVDEEKSDFKKFQENDPIRPDLAGLYSNFFKLIIAPEKIENSNFFRIKKFDLAIVISEPIKEKIEKFTGVKFELITEQPN